MLHPRLLGTHIRRRYFLVRSHKMDKMTEYTGLHQRRVEGDIPNRTTHNIKFCSN